VSLDDLTGRRFGRLVVVARGPNARDGGAAWACLCDCGGRTIASARNLKAGRTLGCGCLRGLPGAPSKRRKPVEAPDGTVYDSLAAAAARHGVSTGNVWYWLRSRPGWAYLGGPA
jgi:hypothetical protein